MAPNFEPFYGGNRRRSELWARKTAGQGLSLEEKAELQGRIYFPNNPKAADLLKMYILKQTTEDAGLDRYFTEEEEEAELDGYLIFRDNPRAADLLTKLFLGQIIEEERKELEEYFQEYFQRKKFSPEVNSTWDRVKARDPNVGQVNMNQGKALEVSPGDDEKIK